MDNREQKKKKDSAEKKKQTNKLEDSKQGPSRAREIKSCVYEFQIGGVENCNKNLPAPPFTCLHPFIADNGIS